MKCANYRGIIWLRPECRGWGQGVYRGYIGIMETKTATTIMGYIRGYRVYIGDILG